MLDLDRMARLKEPEVRAEFVHVWRVMQEKYADLSLLERALAERRSNLIQSDLPWQGLINALYVEYHRILLKLFEQGGQAQFDDLMPKRITKIDLSGVSFSASGFGVVGRIEKAERPGAFDVSHPEAERWARTYAGQLVQGLTAQSRLAMADAIAEFIRLKIPPAEGARMLRAMLGQTPRSAAAIVRFQNDLRLRGFDARYIQQKTDEYSRRWLNFRARTVARTETLRALQEGQRQSFSQAVEQGLLIPSRTRKQWVTAADERVCFRCAPMDGQIVPIDEPWQTIDGPVQVPSALHVQCRCASVLVFPNASGEFPERPPRPGFTGQPRTTRTLRPKVRREP